MVRNVPSIIKMMREFKKLDKESPADSEENKGKEEPESKTGADSDKKKESFKKVPIKENKPSKKARFKPGIKNIKAKNVCLMTLIV